MKKYLILALLVGSAFALAAQVPSITTSSKIKFVEGNNVWLGSVSELASIISAGAGTVTSVDVSGGSTGLSTSGGPITSSGTITFAGTLDADNGGTGQSSYTVGDLLSANTTSTLSKIAAASTGNALISAGTGTLPTWGKIGLATHVSGTLPVGNGGTGLTAVGGNGTVLGSDGSANVYFSPTITTSAAAIAYSVSGSNLNLNLPNADASNRGTVSTSSQTFAGAKTFNALLTGAAGVASTASATAPAFQSAGVFSQTWTTVTSTTTLDEDNGHTNIGTLSAGISLNLPACNATRDGWEFNFLKIGSDTYGATIDPNGSETFTDSATTKTLYSAGVGAKCRCLWNGSTGSWTFATN